MIKNNLVGFEVLTGVVMKSAIFWDITPCSPLKVDQRFGGTYRLHLRGRSISRVRKQCENRCSRGFRLYTLFSIELLDKCER
jgi:hypothetical protein